MATTSKTQAIRLLDVFVFGPLMIQAGRSHKSDYFSTALTLIGLGTIIYNGANYLQERQRIATGGDALDGLNDCCEPCRRGRRRSNA